jgi:hypothetical protein
MSPSYAPAILPRPNELKIHGFVSKKKKQCSQVQKGARLDGKRARAVVPYGRTLGQNTVWRHGQRRLTAWRCGGEELPEGSSRESKLSL